ncbi:MAG: electron transfer flavoprotein subunit beta/FixA family protein [Raoultibacter sp.]|jgi:electron transfer flavoprotein alpha/beta subunit
MNIVVCIKQVPDTTEIKIDPVKNTLIRAGVPSIMNPYDRHAVEAALQMKDRYGARVTVISMGPAQAKSILREALSMGADDAYLVTDRAFGGSDTFATSYILAAVIRYLGSVDMVFGGKQAIDGDTGQTVASLAEHLGLPMITHALDVEVCDRKVIARRITDEGFERVRTSIPLICTFTKESNKPRYATLASKIDSLTAEIPEIHLEDIERLIDTTKIGLKGSPTRVKKTFVPPREASGLHISGSAPDAAAKLISELSTAKVL